MLEFSVDMLTVVLLLAQNGSKNYTDQVPNYKTPFDMVYLPGGKFKMGTPGGEADEPAREVDVKPFWIGKTEVTWDEYEIFSFAKDLPKGADASSRPSTTYDPQDRGWGTGQRPAIGMQWNGAKQYCEWLSEKTGKKYRLPTEAEWEFACRGGTTTAYFFGDKPDALGDYAWFVGNGEKMTHEVAQKKPNPFGLYDMLGNVLEFCDGTYSEETKKAVLRGGSFEDPPNVVRSAKRIMFQFKWIERDPQRPRSQWWALDGPTGFRLARSAD